MTHVYETSRREYFIREPGEYIPARLPDNIGRRMMNEPKWFKINGAYHKLSLRVNGTKYHIIDNIINATTFVESTKCSAINTYKLHTEMHVTACDDGLIGFVITFINNRLNEIELINIRHDGDELIIGQVEYHRIHPYYCEFYAVWDSGHKRLHRLYQINIDDNPIFDIDGGFGGCVYSGLSSPECITIYNGIMILFEGSRKVTHDIDGKCIDDCNDIQRWDICVYGCIIVCITKTPDHLSPVWTINAYDMRTGDTYEMCGIDRTNICRDTLIANV